MKKLAIAVMAVIGLVLYAAPETNACSTHGYVRASTLNDLFSGVANNDNGLVFEAGTQGNGHADEHLGDPNLDTGHYDDGHAFGWKMKDSNGGAWHDMDMGNGDVHAQLDSIITAIEQGMSESMDKNFAD